MKVAVLGSLNEERVHDQMLVFPLMAMVSLGYRQFHSRAEHVLQLVFFFPT